MSFEAYLKNWLNINESLNEVSTPAKSTTGLDQVRDAIRYGIGGETDDKIARTTSFETIEKVLQNLDVFVLEKVKSEPELQKVLLEMIAPGKIEWFGEYLSKSKKNLNAINSDKKKIDPSLNFNAYTRLTLREADVKNRIYKMHMIFKNASNLPDLDSDSSMLLALRQLDADLKSSMDGTTPNYKVTAIGLIDNIVKSDEFVVIDSNGEKKILKKSNLKDLLEINPEIAQQAKNLASDSYKKKVEKLTNRTEETIKKDIAASFTDTAKVISELPNNGTTMEKLQVDWKPLIDALGYTKFFSAPIKQKEKEIIKTERPSLRKKNRIKEKLMGALRSSLLPPMVNGEISQPGGDYYKLFKRLESQNAAWVEASLREVLGDSSRISQFNASARTTESSLEENQLAYLQVSSTWITKYIESEVDGELSKRDTDNGISKIKNTTLEKEKEIKNYYLSKDFNMSNFNGIRLRPGVKLPLYQRVKLTVSEADRIAESPLKNLLRGLGQIMVGLFSTIPDRGDAVVAKRNADQNRAIFNGIFSIIKSGAYAVNAQTGRDLEKGVSKVTSKLRLDTIGMKPYEKGEGPQFYKSAEKKTNEQEMASVSPGQVMQTPDSLPSNNMDTFALAGPGRKEKKNKKKSLITKVSNFNDFLKSKD
jgi:hypothetical protein